MRKIKIGRKASRLPSTYSEATQKQVFTFLSMLFSNRYEGGGLQDPPAKLKVELLLKLIRINYKHINQLNDHELAALTDILKFFWEEPCTVPVMPWFVHGIHTYFLPDEGLKYSTFIEFILADHYFQQLSKEENYDHNLNMLVATLCRPQKFFWPFIKNLPSNDGDRRIKLNTQLIERTAKTFGKVPYIYKLFVFWFYKGCFQNILKQYPIFSSGGEEGQQSQGNAVTQQFGWWAILSDLASQGTFGNYEETMFTNLHAVLLELTINQKKYKEVQKQQEKQRKQMERKQRSRKR